MTSIDLILAHILPRPPDHMCSLITKTGEFVTTRSSGQALMSMPAIILLLFDM